MIKLGQKIEILRMHFVEDKPKKQIARELKISKNTVKTYITEFLNNKKELIESGVSKFELIENMVESPKYNSTGRKAVVMTDEVKEIIRKFLKNNEIKISNGNRKQIMTSQDMYEELLEKGFSLSYTSVSQYVQKYKENEYTYEAFIKQQYDFGDVCEFDWGEVKLIIDGNNIKLRMAVFSLAKSNFRFAYLYTHENTQSFVDAHIRFFKHINGVPKTMVYDNMKVAVAKFVGRTEKEATEALKKLSVYYGFRYRFCNIRSGNEKGHVENSVDFVRRKAFACNNIFSNIGSALDRLSERLKKHNNIKTKYLNNCSPYELLEKEQKYLLTLMPEYINCSTVNARVDKLSTISYLQNRYSVPDFLVQKIVEAKIYVDKIEIYFNNSLVSTHIRLNGKQEWSIDIFHFKKTLTRKPGALIGSVAFEQMSNTLKQIYNKHFKDNNKSFIELLNIVGEQNINTINNIVTKLEEQRVCVTVDTIKMILNRNDNCNNNVNSSHSNMQKQIEQFSKKHLQQYDAIIGTRDIKEVVVV